MKFHRKIAVFISTIALLILTAVPGNAAVNYDVIYNSCKKEISTSNSVCNCIVKNVKERLNERETQFLIAAVEQDTAAMTKLQQTISSEEMSNVMNFMSVTPPRCQSQ